MKKGISWAVLLSVIVLAVALALTPHLIVAPTENQTAGELAFVFNLGKVRSVAMVFLAACAVFLVTAIWRKSGGWGKALAAISLAPLGFATWLTFTNPYEMMFKPLPQPSFADIKDVDFLDEDDLVLSVVLNGEAAAYPLRQLAYHHIVHDEVGGVPIVATY